MAATVQDLVELRATAFRIVEAQHRVATLKLVDTAAEHELLEDLIEQSKPERVHTDLRGLHYLLATPFRYPPLRHGSRYGRRDERGLFYGSETVPVALAEAAYYRLLFLAGTAAPIEHTVSEHTVFSVAITTERGVDLTAGRFRLQRAVLASPVDYGATQALGSSMRTLGVEAFRSPSARARGGVNLGVFSPSVFGSRQPRGLQTWHCTTTRQRVVFVRRDVLRHEEIEFGLDGFLVDGRLPAPAV
ncbi:MAG: RES family NAD+ phosphorylase [Planctomycetota bacterium]